MEIKIDRNNEKRVVIPFPKGCKLCKARQKSTGEIYLIIPGYEETHFITNKGSISYIRNDDDRYLNENYEFIEEVDLTWD